MEVFVFLSIFLLIGVILFLSFSGDLKPQQSRSVSEFAGCPEGFSPSLVYMEKCGTGGIAVDQHSKRLCLVKSDFQTKVVIQHTDLLGAVIVEDGVSIAKVIKKDDTAKKVVEMALGSEEKTKPDTQASTPVSVVERIDLKIITKNREDPIHVVNFLNMEAKVGGFIYNDAAEQVKTWQSVIGALIRRADQKAQAISVEAEQQ